MNNLILLIRKPYFTCINYYPDILQEILPHHSIAVQHGENNGRQKMVSRQNLRYGQDAGAHCDIVFYHGICWFWRNDFVFDRDISGIINRQKLLYLQLESSLYHPCTFSFHFSDPRELNI